MGSIIGAVVGAILSSIWRLITGQWRKDKELDNAREQGRDEVIARENQVAAEKENEIAKVAVNRPSAHDVDKRLRNGTF